MPHARQMDFTGRALKGFVYVDPKGFESDGNYGNGLNYVSGLPVPCQPSNDVSASI